MDTRHQTAEAYAWGRMDAAGYRTENYFSKAYGFAKFYVENYDTEPVLRFAWEQYER
jgi:hypothetical protein